MKIIRVEPIPLHLPFASPLYHTLYAQAAVGDALSRSFACGLVPRAAVAASAEEVCRKRRRDTRSDLMAPWAKAG